jgi:hypothetical protein
LSTHTLHYHYEDGDKYALLPMNPTLPVTLERTQIERITLLWESLTDFDLKMVGVNSGNVDDTDRCIVFGDSNCPWAHMITKDIYVSPPPKKKCLF